jgi:hypothetical protein
MKWLYLLPLLLIAACDSGGNKKPKPCSAYVTWEAPVFRADGSTISIDEIQKFTLYVNRTAPRTLEDETLVMIIDITDPVVRDYAISDVGQGQRYFYLTVTDTDGNTSAISNVLAKYCR